MRCVTMEVKEGEGQGASGKVCGRYVKVSELLSFRASSGTDFLLVCVHRSNSD